jgi:hypothetical protein
MVLLLNPLIHTLPRMVHAILTEVISKLQVFNQPRDALESKMLFKQDQLEFQQMLPTGADTAQVFSITAEQILTTTSSSLEYLTLIGKLKTLGQPHGERKDLLDWLQETLVVSVLTNHHGSND